MINRYNFEALTAYHAENLDTEAWRACYLDPELSYHRILVRHNFCPGSKGYWTETNSERITDKKIVISNI